MVLIVLKITPSILILSEDIFWEIFSIEGELYTSGRNNDAGSTIIEGYGTGTHWAILLLSR